jgi:hypothetical protein
MRFAAAGRAKEETRLHTRRVTGAAQFRIAKKSARALCVRFGARRRARRRPSSWAKKFAKNPNKTLCFGGGSSLRCGSQRLVRSSHETLVPSDWRNRVAACRPREWVFVQLADRWYVRDARWKLYNDGTLCDMSDAPFAEKPLAPEAMTPEARAARKRLQAVLDALHPGQLKAAPKFKHE